jgi:hypothetical protein
MGVAHRAALAVLVCVSGIVPSLLGAQTTPPGDRFRTFDTPHFRVVYGEGLHELAERAAAHAEEAHRILRERFFPAPDVPIELLVTDHSDLSNGLASSTPLPRVVLWARPPMDGTALSHFDDWIRLVTVHEVAHIFHLEHTGRLGRLARAVFGRAPLAWPWFTGHLLPTWAIEGVAVQLESEHTEAGRIHGTAQLSTVRAQAVGSGIERLDQAIGISPVHPGGTRPYIFGGLFFHWLEEEYGHGTARDFLDAAARQWIPYRLDAAARDATGRSLVELWDEWRAAVVAEVHVAQGGRRESTIGLEQLTEGARSARHPAPHPDGHGVVYVRSDGRSDTRIVTIEESGVESTLTRWNGSGPLRWTREGALLASQPEFVDPWRLRQDLYRVEASGEAVRLTRNARLIHPDPHPVSGVNVAVQEGGGTNRLVLVSGDGTSVRELSPFVASTHWAYPIWSPEGDRIAAVRWERGGWTSIVILDPDSQDEVVVHRDRSLNTAPAWSPEGRWLLWASDRDGALNIVAREVVGGGPSGVLRQVTHTLAGATDPAVDAGAAWLYLSLQDADGWELARLPFDPGSWPEAEPALARFVSAPGAGVDASEEGRPGATGIPATLSPSDMPRAEPARAMIVREDRPWSALPSLLPRHWYPLFIGEERVGERAVLPGAIGIESSGRDLVGRHSWSGRVSSPWSDPSRRVELGARWRWAGLGQPALVLDVEQTHRTLGVLTPSQAPGDSLFPVSRERRAGVSAEFMRQRVRSGAVLSVGVREIQEERTLLEEDATPSTRFSLIEPSRALTELRGGFAVSTVRSHAFSISPESGLSLSVQARERLHRALPDSLRGVGGADGAFREGIGVVRAFVPLPFPGSDRSFARGVLALRGAGGVVDGPGAGRSHFRVGGGGGGDAFSWDTGTPTFAVRGHPSGAVAGDRAWAGSAELRLPLALIHSGRGALPVHLDRLAWGAFFEAGGAWRSEEGRRRHEMRSSVGIEAVLFNTLFFRERYRLRAGAALPLEGGQGLGGYVQLGWSH